MRKEKSEMLFHEIYGSYYNVIAAVLSEAVNGTLEDKKFVRSYRRRLLMKVS